MEIKIHFEKSPKSFELEVSEDGKSWTISNAWDVCNPALKDVSDVLDEEKNPG